MSNLLEIEDLPHVRIVRFCRPESRNALSADVLDAMDKAISTLGDCALIFTGVGAAFASGANLNEISELTIESAPAFARRGQTLMTRIANLEQQTIAAINGHCFGGALDLALSCDIRIASPNAQFAHPGAGLGIITGWGGTQRLPRLVGLANSFEMFFTASPIDAKRALRIGLVDEIADDVLARALETLR
jgi:enoyl-CoA hydratase